MNTPNIKSFTQVVPMIYAYNTPGIPYHDGWTKIGYTEKQSVEDRINQQTYTAGIKWTLAWQDNAMYKDGSGDYFTDHDFHNHLEKEYNTPRESDTEWFQIDGNTSAQYFQRFASRKGVETPEEEQFEYALRQEQENAVNTTKSYFENGGTEFLWNAKPRFGKTLTSYDLARRMGFKKVLIVTNRPSISNSWADDFKKFIGWRGDFEFVSETEALKNKAGVLTRKEYVDRRGPIFETGMIAFESLQGLKGSSYFGGNINKLSWIKDNEFDLLIVDEAQEGVDTMRTDRAFRSIRRKYTLYLSGTPFKALAGDQFTTEQIFNWSYADEQEAKATWDDDGYNPYERLPKMEMYTYQLSPMIRERIEKGLDLSEDGIDEYAFDLNEFFMTNENGKFIHEDDIKKFVHALSTQEKYPYSTPRLREELSHTLWLLNRISSAKALAKMLQEDPVFCEYHVILAAGDGRLAEEDDAKASYDKVKEAISKYDKTITLSVGQLTVGVTVPEWSGVLMLCNLKSPSAYMQAAFRTQNPCSITKDGKRYLKETAYVFDFDPARTLIIFDEFANNLSMDTVDGRGAEDDRKTNIKRLLNFFPVLGEDSDGVMVELDAEKVLSIPKTIKSQEVVRRGFMSNFLFQNIGNVFGAPGVVRDIVEKLTPAHEEPKRRDKDKLSEMPDINVDEQGNVEISDEIIIGKAQDIFGKKVHENIISNITPAVDDIGTEDDFTVVTEKIEKMIKTVKVNLKERIIEPVIEEYDLKAGAKKRIEKDLEKEVENTLIRVRDDYKQNANIAKAKYETKRKEATKEQDIKIADDEYKADIDKALQDLAEATKTVVAKTIEDKPREVIEQIEKNKAESEKRIIEDTVRDHLRGFARTIPSFIMAYGDGNITLRNIDKYTEDDVFQEVTGISEDDFRFLRDGGEYPDPESGEDKHFEGKLFDEIVFNDSVKEFWNKRTQLANYFDESNEEDIFDYIPPQKTNQIFTPRWVVSKMVDDLEKNNPGCFDDPTKTFADLYMKSGQYITEIVKRLYRSDGLKSAFPDGDERIRNILRNQVYGMAPTRIIYLIATNYILGFDETLKDEIKNFVQCDAAEASKEETLETLVNESFE
jgi:superfamily II DNA or RNA helicase